VSKAVQIYYSGINTTKIRTTVANKAVADSPRQNGGITRTPDNLEKARAYKEEVATKLFGVRALASPGEPAMKIPGKSNIVGLGFGAKSTDGSSSGGELAVRVYVRAKLPKHALTRPETIPSSVNNLPTDVIVVGDLRAFARPTRCGVSIGHFAYTAGTLGCVVTKADEPGKTFILSNNHVLANSNTCSVGDDILEPGPLDGGVRTSPIARLSQWEPLIFGGPSNFVDAAIAEIIKAPEVLPEIPTIGPIAHPEMLASLYQAVRKHGRTTLHTVGVVMDMSADINVLYGSQTAHFEDQLAVVGAGGSFSSGGDSGSLVVDAMTRRAVGLLFAGGSRTTFVNPIDQVLSRLKIQII
jgi:hypothetical protein